MNKKNSQQLVYAILLVAVAVFIGILAAFVPQTFDEYNSTKSQVESNKLELEKLEQQDKKLKEKKEQEEIKLQSLKQIYQSDINANDNLAVYGTIPASLADHIQEFSLVQCLHGSIKKGGRQA